MKKNIVVISFSSYPNQSPRAMRTDELVKELARQGYDVTLYILKGQYDYSYYSNENNINIKSLGKPIFFDFDPRSGTSLNITQKVMRKLLNKHFEFPSIELLFHTYKSLKKEKEIDLLITIAVPYSLHWGAALYRSLNKSKLDNTVWVADCGDPYMGNDFFSKPFYFKYIEKWFCNLTDFISVPLKEAIPAYYPEFKNKIKVIPQGFDFSKTEDLPPYVSNPIPTFIYAGNFYNKIRDPRPFLHYLSTLNQDFKFIVYTKNATLLSDYKNKLDNKLVIRDFIPREKLIIEMSQADFLVNLENPNNKQSPSKLIDYYLANRPILSLNTNSKLKTSLVDDFLNGKYHSEITTNDIQQYDIRNVAKEFLKLMNKK